MLSSSPRFDITTISVKTGENREEWKPELRKRERDETRLMSSAPLSGIFGIKVHDQSMSESEIAIEDEHPGERKRKVLNK